MFDGKAADVRNNPNQFVFTSPIDLSAGNITIYPSVSSRAFIFLDNTDVESDVPLPVNQPYTLIPEKGRDKEWIFRVQSEDGLTVKTYTVIYTAGYPPSLSFQSGYDTVAIRDLSRSYRNHDIAFNVTAFGPYRLTVTRLVDSEDISDASYEEITRTAFATHSVSIPVSSISAEGDYRLTVTDDITSTSSQFYLNVLDDDVGFQFRVVLGTQNTTVSSARRSPYEYAYLTFLEVTHLTFSALSHSSTARVSLQSPFLNGTFENDVGEHMWGISGGNTFSLSLVVTAEDDVTTATYKINIVRGCEGCPCPDGFFGDGSTTCFLPLLECPSTVLTEVVGSHMNCTFALSNGASLLFIFSLSLLLLSDPHLLS